MDQYISPRIVTMYTKANCEFCEKAKNLLKDDAFPCTTPSGAKFESMTHHLCLDQITQMMDLSKLRQEQSELRKKGIYRGIGIISMIEITNPSALFYGIGGARISAQDGCTVRRRRRCEKCDKRFTTYERIELSLPALVKKDGSRVEYSRDKILSSMRLALRKRPVSSGNAEVCVVLI